MIPPSGCQLSLPDNPANPAGDHQSNALLHHGTGHDPTIFLPMSERQPRDNAHLPGCTSRKPPDKRAADKALAKEWADYSKPRTAEQIEARPQLADAHT